MGTPKPERAGHRTVDRERRRGALRAGRYLVPCSVAALGILLTIGGFLYAHSLATRIPASGHEPPTARGGFAMWFILTAGLLYTAFVTVCFVVMLRRTRRQASEKAETPIGPACDDECAPEITNAAKVRADSLPGPEAMPPRFRLMETLPAAVFFYDRTHRLQWMNNWARKIARINQVDYVGQPCYVTWGKSAIPCTHCPMKPESMEQAEPMAAHDFSTADGRRWSLLAYPICDDDGNVSGIVKIGRDISERVAASTLLERERATFERILDQNPSSIAVFTPEGRFIRANPAFFDLFGLPGYSTPVDYSLFEDPILLENGLQDELEQLRAGQAVDIPAVRYNASRVIPEALDRTVFVGARAYPIMDSDGKVESIILSHEDLTRRDQIEQELQSSQERLALALDPSSEGLWDFDLAQGKVNYFSPRWFTMLGWGPRELPETFETWVQLLHPEDRPWVEQLGGAILREGIEMSSEYRMAHKDGGYRWISSRGRVVKRDTDGNPVRMIGIHVDITARKEAEARIQELQAQLAHASRLSTMGELAAGFAHELNQPLTAIASYARAAVRNLDAQRVTPEDVGETLRKISQQAERAGAVIRSLRGYVRPTSSQAQLSRCTDVNECAREATLLLSHEVRRNNVRIQLSLGTDLSDVSIGRIELVQVFVNLVLNAIEALASTEREDRELSIQTAVVGQGRIEVKVADNGPGLSRATAEQIFEPFMTTKPDGMGVGLAICRRIIEAHGGHLSAANNDSGGAVFTFSLCPAHGRNTHDC